MAFSGFKEVQARIVTEHTLVTCSAKTTFYCGMTKNSHTKAEPPEEEEVAVINTAPTASPANQQMALAASVHVEQRKTVCALPRRLQK